MVKQLLGTGATVLCFLLTGCAGFKAHNLPDVNESEIKSTAAEKTKVYSRWEVVPQSNPQVQAMVAALHKKHFEDALNYAGCCMIAESAKDADIVVDGKFYDEFERAALIPAFITGLSLYTIPSWATINAHISATAQGGGATKSYELQDSTKMVQWLPMIFALPFADNPFKAEREVIENTYRTLVLRMKKDGLIK